ncbi:MAG: TetR/AcrR family transcriptional regulator [Nannocystaceae bacterium]|nr:TetR/AcrR family transcriptional regulator [Nannocystaceae bacterium]
MRAPERRREVLVAALELMAEQGYAGASLRKLADKLGMRQPSLYHYFRSKEDLVEQVIHTFAADMMEVSLQHLPQRLEEVPAWVRDSVLALYERPTHPLFVRVLFSISRSHPRYGKLMRELFVDRVDMAIRLFAQPFVARGDIGERDAVYLARMAINAIGLKLMEERVLFDEQPIHADVRAYADFVVENMELLLRARAARRRATPRARRGAVG